MLQHVLLQVLCRYSQLITVQRITATTKTNLKVICKLSERYIAINCLQKPYSHPHAFIGYVIVPMGRIQNSLLTVTHLRKSVAGS